MANTIIVHIENADTLADIQNVLVKCYTDADVQTGGDQLTDATGNCTFAGLAQATKYYFTTTLNGYIPLSKTGNFGQQLKYTYTVATDDILVEIVLHPARARSSCNALLGIGAAIGTQQTGLAAAVTTYTDPGAVKVEDITCTANGDGKMDESLYTAGVAYYAVFTLAGYNSVTVHFDFQLGFCPTALLKAAVGTDTYTITGRLLYPDGTPKVGQVLKYTVGPKLFSQTQNALEYYAATAGTFSVTVDANGEFEIEVMDLMVVIPQGWDAVFGYPTTYIYVNGANVDLGDGSAGVI